MDLWSITLYGKFKMEKASIESCLIGSVQFFIGYPSMSYKMFSNGRKLPRDTCTCELQLALALACH